MGAAALLLDAPPEEEAMGTNELLTKATSVATAAPCNNKYRPSEYLYVHVNALMDAHDY